MIVMLAFSLVLAVPALSYGKPRANGFMSVSCGKKYDWCLEHDGYKYRNNTLYNITKQQGEYVWVIDESGNTRKLQFAKYVGGYGSSRLKFLRYINTVYVGGRWSYDTEWDFEKNRPVVDRPDQYFKRYYHWWLVALSRYFPFWQVAIVAMLSVYFWIARKGWHDPVTGSDEAREFCRWTMFWTGVILVVGLWPGALYSGILDRYDDLYRYLDTRRLPSGWFLPLNRGVVIPFSTRYELIGGPYVLLFVGLHLVLVPWVLLRSGSFLRGLHYVFVPHPAAEVVKGSKGEASDHKALVKAVERADLASELETPRRFVSENMKRKAEELAALARRRRAEKTLIDEHEQLVREEQASRDKGRRDE